MFALSQGCQDYAVVIIMAVFIYAATSWVFSARRWFKGPVSNLSKEPSLEEKSPAYVD